MVYILLEKYAIGTIVAGKEVNIIAEKRIVEKIKKIKGVKSVKSNLKVEKKK